MVLLLLLAPTEYIDLTPLLQSNFVIVMLTLTLITSFAFFHAGSNSAKK